MYQQPTLNSSVAGKFQQLGRGNTKPLANAGNTRGGSLNVRPAAKAPQLGAVGSASKKPLFPPSYYPQHDDANYMSGHQLSTPGYASYATGPFSTGAAGASLTNNGCSMYSSNQLLPYFQHLQNAPIGDQAAIPNTGVLRSTANDSSASSSADSSADSDGIFDGGDNRPLYPAPDDGLWSPRVPHSPLKTPDGIRIDLAASRADILNGVRELQGNIATNTFTPEQRKVWQVVAAHEINRQRAGIHFVLGRKMLAEVDTTRTRGLCVRELAKWIKTDIGWMWISPAGEPVDVHDMKLIDMEQVLNEQLREASNPAQRQQQ